jgi:uncharacterized Zn-binding protein involved in type VI secretion
MGKPAVYDPTQLTNHTSFTPSPLIPGPLGHSRNVFIEGRPAVPAGSKFIVHDIPPDGVSVLIRPPHNDIVLDGCPNVFVNGKPMARVGDKIVAPITFYPAPLSPAGFLRSGAVTVNCSDLPGLPIITI